VFTILLIGCAKTSEFKTSDEVVKYLISSNWEIEEGRQTYVYEFKENRVTVKQKEKLGERGEKWSYHFKDGIKFEHIIDRWVWEGEDLRIIVWDNGEVISEGVYGKGPFMKVMF